MNSEAISASQVKLNLLSLSGLFSTHPQKIGLRYLLSMSVMFVLGLIPILILLVKTHLLGMSGSLTQEYGSIANLHGFTMIFFFIIPLIHTVGGNLWLPHFLKTERVAFARLNNFGWWYYAVGCLMIIVAGLNNRNAIDWKLYNTEISLTLSNLLFLGGVFLSTLSLVFMSLIIITTIHTMRDKSTAWSKLPVIVNAYYVSSILFILTLPLLLLYIGLYFAEILFGLGFLNPIMGGDIIMSKQIFWIFAHPIMYALFIAGAGIITELINRYNKDRLEPDKLIKIAIIALAGVGLFGWGQHLFVSGLSERYVTFFAFFGLLPLVPFSIIILRWIFTIVKESITYSVPVIFSMLSIIMILIGGATGLFLVIPALNIHLHNTTFVSAHTHIFMIGVVGLTFVAMMLHFWKEIWKKNYHDVLMKITALTVFSGLIFSEGSRLMLGLKGRSSQLFLSNSDGLLSILGGIGSMLLVVGLILLSTNLLFYSKQK